MEARVISNFTVVEVDEKPQRIGIPAADIAMKLLRVVAPIQIKRINRDVFAIDDESGEVWSFDQESDLFGFIAAKNINVHWLNRVGCISKTEFLKCVGSLVEEVVGISLLPHEPKIPNMHYAKCRVNGDRYTGFLDQVVDFWKPSKPQDQSLIKAAFVSLFWGGRPGSRPAISIESDGHDNGRGIGKSQLMYALANLGGGHIDCNLKESISDVKKRILADGTKVSVVAFDNCKTSKLSNGDLEGLITAPVVSGHKMYKGNRELYNNFTYIFTMNDASLSADMSSRSMRIVLARQVTDPTWQTRLDDLIREHRHDIINDCIFTLRQQVNQFSKFFRFNHWQTQVLSKIDHSDEVIQLLLDRQLEVDADHEVAEDLRDIIVGCISEYSRGGSSGMVALDPLTNTILIPRWIAAHWICQRFEGVKSHNAATALIKRSKTKELVDMGDKRLGMRMWRWVPSVTSLEGAWRINSLNPRDPVSWQKFHAVCPNIAPNVPHENDNGSKVLHEIGAMGQNI